MSKRYPGNFITGNPVALSQTSNNGIWDLKDNYQATNSGVWQEANGIYEIGRSLRFRPAAGSYFNKTMASGGSRTTWTFSVWYKRGNQPGETLFSAGLISGTYYYGRLGLNADGKMHFLIYNDTNNGWMESANRLRDSSAWYHLVWVFDTTNVVTSERMRMYINGERVTQFETTSFSTTYPAQNGVSVFNNTSYTHKIGKTEDGQGSANTPDGHMAELNFIDGQALDPSYFGYNDPVTNIWQPKKYTGVYGTNGFYLPFNEYGSSRELGKNFGNGSNYITYSEQFDSGNWVKPAAPVAPTISANHPGTLAPNGTQTVDVVIFSGSTTHPCYQEYTPSGGIPNGESWTASMYVKRATGGTFALQCTIFTASSGPLQDGYNTFEFQDNGALITKSTGSASAYMSTGHEYIGDGWYRIWATNTNNSGSTGAFIRMSIGQVSATTAWSIFCWGAQLHVGKKLLPYVQTTSSAISNDWTPNYFSLTPGVTYDSMVDSPTNVFTPATDVGGVVSGNYATLNPIGGSHWSGTSPATSLLLDANLKHNEVVHGIAMSTQVIEKYPVYWEVYLTNWNIFSGIIAANSQSDAAYSYADSSAYGVYPWSTGAWVNAGVMTSPGTQYALGTSGSGTFHFACDPVAGKMWVGYNGTWRGDPVAGTGNDFTIPTGQQWVTWSHICNTGQSNTATYNFGQRPFAYTPPSGFKSLNTTNLQSLGTSAVGKAALRPTKYFDVVLDRGNTTGRNISGLEFSPNLAIMKDMDRTTNARWSWFDTKRGAGAHITSQLGEVESNRGDTLTSFNSDGISIGADAGLYGTNGYNERWFHWLMKESPQSGLNIITYTEAAGSNSISHNLGVPPKMIIIKQRNLTSSWVVWHDVFGAPTVNGLYLNSTSTKATSGSNWFTSVNSSNVTYNSGQYSSSGYNNVMYLFADVPGFSKISSYRCNGSTDGTFVYTGFKPKLIIIKSADTFASAWHIFNTERDTYNPTQYHLSLEANEIEYYGSNQYIDVLSNGFKLRNATGQLNNSTAQTNIYAAFAENPFALNNRAF